MPTDADLMKRGVKRRERPARRASRRTPAWAGTRSPPAPGRASTARRTTPSTAPARATSTTRRASPTTGILQADHIAPGGRARGQDGRLGGVGRARASSCPRCRARSSTSARFFSRPRHRAQLRPARPAGRRERVRRRRTSGSTLDDAAAAGRTSRPRSARRSRRQFTLTTTFAARPRSTGVYDLYIYDSTNDGTVNYDRVLSSSAADAGKNGATAVADLGPGRVGRRQGRRSLRRARRQDGRLLRQGDRHRARPVASSASTSRRCSGSNATLQRARRRPARPPSRRRSNATSRPRRRRTSPRSRRASSTRTPTSSRGSCGRTRTGRTCTTSSHDASASSPTCCSLGAPTTDEFQHQFIGAGHADRHRRQPEPVLRRPHQRRRARRPGRRCARATSARRTRRPTTR